MTMDIIVTKNLFINAYLNHLSSHDAWYMSPDSQRHRMSAAEKNLHICYHWSTHNCNTLYRLHLQIMRLYMLLTSWPYKTKSKLCSKCWQSTSVHGTRKDLSSYNLTHCSLTIPFTCRCHYVLLCYLLVLFPV